MPVATFQPKAVIALGDPYKADYVGVVVPGVNNELSNVEGVMEKAAALREEIKVTSGAPVLDRSASIAWLGYDSPESLLDAMDRNEAKAGARSLRLFVDSLKAGQLDDEAPQLSILGHSYGSTTGAMAVREGMKVDNLILLGSPGAATRTGKKLKAADNLWAARARKDPIKVGAVFSWLGEDPTHRNFGAKKIPLGTDQTGHDEYFQRKSTGLKNLAKIVVSKDSDVE